MASRAQRPTPSATYRAPQVAGRAAFPVRRALCVLSAGALLAGCSAAKEGGDDIPRVTRWADTTVNVVSRPMTAEGVTAATALGERGALRTVVHDVATGAPLWAERATMAGRPNSMGVQPPAIVGGMVVAVEPRPNGKKAIVAREAREGLERWVRPVTATYGPTACGANVCLTELAGGAKTRFTVLEGATGRPLWRVPGIAEVQHADADRLVLLRRTPRPAVAAYGPATGVREWTYPLAAAVGSDADLDGGWAAGVADGMLLGYVGPNRKGSRLTSFGYFALRLTDGRRVWSRPGLLRVHPSASPAVAIVGRELGKRGAYGGFTRLDRATGAKGPIVPATALPQDTPWWLSFSDDLANVGFLAGRRAGTAYSLARGNAVTADGMRTWGFCTVTPAALKLKGGLKGFYPTASLCPYDLAGGRRADDQTIAPPSWYTGATDGWRVWRDEKGALHGVNDGAGTIPGMYGR
ncbi:putative pyrroloquinoline-quinone binding quinoprotein [Actinocorallia herbida]|uniref:Putative pyrroloquinoline-quinone binding quinoprotein n=1 Tax=Actinocorallia herbida TaxID=58109 RepID=A0A3N1CN89_9ACTN|nr:PQQ-binding-like beta-propeller repeat protein [Actinocorallia herbida]ROO82772.1 putative pyrroloquinoline-quinone binding quinoprotein [Actinocorallia herbida]